MITDKLKALIIDELNSLVSTADLGMGGNSTNPVATALDVPLGLSDVQAVKTAAESDLNVIEFKITVEGTHIDGKVIREAALFHSDGEILHRVNFDGIGPIATTDTLEIFLLMEVE